MEDNYGYQYGGWQEPGKRDESNAFGIASLALGIISLLLFCACVNWLTGILAIIFGIIQIVKHDRKGLAIGGIVTAGLSMLLAVILYISIALGISAAGMSYDDLYDYYFGYDYYDDYYGDYDDYYDDYYGGYYDYYDDYYGGYYDYYDDYYGGYDYYGDYYDDYYYDGYDGYESSGNEFLSWKD